MPLRLRLLLQSCKYRIVIKFPLNRCRFEARLLTRSVNVLVILGIGKNWLSSGMSPLFKFGRRMMKVIVTIIQAHHCRQPHTIFAQPIFLVKSSMYMYKKSIRGNQFAFRCNSWSVDNVFRIHHVLGKKRIYSAAEHHIFVDFKKVHDYVRRDSMFNNLIECGILMILNTSWVSYGVLKLNP